MKNNDIVREALFGSDHDGRENWFCWRIALGCSGSLAILTYEDDKGKDLVTFSSDASSNIVQLPSNASQVPLNARPLLFLPSWLQYREKDGFFGVQTRPLTRSSRGRDYRSQFRGNRQTAAEMRKDWQYLSDPSQANAPGIMEGIAEEFSEEKVAATRDILVARHDPARERDPHKKYHLLPAIVQCRACRAKSHMPALKSTKRVVNGRLLPWKRHSIFLEMGKMLAGKSSAFIPGKIF